MIKNHKVANILFSSALILLTLLASVSSTLAWFATRRNVSVQADGFQVTLPESQKATLYYHSKNYSKSLNAYSGFEVAQLQENEMSSFKEYDENKSKNPSPTSTKFLWPNHQLTYALVFTPIRTGTFTFDLSSWESVGNNDKLIDEATPIRLSYAIDIYAMAYEDATFSKAKDFFQNKDDKFKDSPVSRASEKVNILTYDVTDTTKKVTLYFSILFSNHPSTYYAKPKDETYYQNDPNSPEQSDCYEGLQFNAKSFSLHAPELV